MLTLLILLLAIFCIIGYFNKNLTWFSLPVAFGIFIIGTILLAIFRNIMLWMIYVLGTAVILFVILIIISKLKK